MSKASHLRLVPDNEDLPVSPETTAAEITFPEGLVGLPALVSYRLVSVPDTTLFEIVSTDDPVIGFIAAPADDIRPGTTGRLKEKGLVAEGEWVLAILAVHGEPPGVTANLAGPLVLDMEKATARQLVVEDPDFPLQVPVAEEG